MRARALALAAVVLAAAGVAAAALLGRDGEADGQSVNRGGRTVAVSRQTLVERETVQGTLGYAGNRTVLYRLGGSGDETPSGSADSTSSGAESTGAAATDAPALIPAAYFQPDQDPSVEDEQPKSEERPQEKEEPAPKEEEEEKKKPAPEEEPVPEEEEPAPEEEEEPASDDSEQGEASPGDSAGQDPSAGESTGSASQTDPGTSSSDGARGGQTGSPQDDASSGDSSSGSGDSGATSSNTVTALARPGSVVRRGGALYRVDGDPVVLMYGSTPAYRDLEVGVEDGADVRQLERNLAALGFDPGTVDTSFTSATADAVTDWQESNGLPEAGSVELGRVVFQPGARRIGEHKTEVGSVLAAGAEVLDTSSTRRVVTVELDAALQSIAREGGGVEVTLPDQSTVRGRITDVGRVAREKEDSGTDAADPAAEPELVIDVTVRLRSARGLGRLDEAPVSVGLAQESRRNALAVPVNALVARRGGGYGVELASSGRIVPVRTGLFADGYVAVSGQDIREGTRVVVPDA